MKWCIYFTCPEPFPLSTKRTPGKNGENLSSPTTGQAEYAIPPLTLTGFGLAHIPGRNNSIIYSEINVVLGDSRILSPEIRKKKYKTKA